MSRVSNEHTGWEECSVCGLPIPASNAWQFISVDDNGESTLAYYCKDKDLCHEFLDLPLDKVKQS